MARNSLRFISLSRFLSLMVSPSYMIYHNLFSYLLEPVQFARQTEVHDPVQFPPQCPEQLPAQDPSQVPLHPVEHVAEQLPTQVP
jgi:hypothetical protein